MERFKVEYYETVDGAKPAEAFILSLDVKMQAKTFRLLTLLEQKGNKLRAPYSKPVGDGIFELRPQVGSDIARVLYFFVVGRTAILTNGFVKKTQQTPEDVIELAKRYRRDYYRRYGGNRTWAKTFE